MAACMCGHDRSEHVDASPDYPALCVAFDESLAGASDDMWAGVCHCLDFRDEETEDL